MFENLSKCTDMAFWYNTISEIEPGAFHGLENLESLMIFENEVESLKPRVFSGLSALTKLWLSNKLTTLDSSIFEDLPRPLQLEVDGNALECNNSLCWLKEEIRNKTITWITSPPRCSSGVSWNSWYTCPGEFYIKCWLYLF